jgi:hypothetical protein
MGKMAGGKDHNNAPCTHLDEAFEIYSKAILMGHKIIVLLCL